MKYWFLFVGLLMITGVAAESCHIELTIEEEVVDGVVLFTLKEADSYYTIGDAEPLNDGEYRLKVYDSSGLLNSYSLSTNRIMVGEYFNRSGKVVESDFGISSVIIPFDSNIEEIRVDNDGVETVLDISLDEVECDNRCINEGDNGDFSSDYCCAGLQSSLVNSDEFVCLDCGDGLCTGQETRSNCPSDCGGALCPSADVDASYGVDALDLGVLREKFGQECNNWCNNADTDKSGVVDAFDLGVLREYFGESCSIDYCNGADIDRSGVVDVFDLVVLRENFGASCSSWDCDGADTDGNRMVDASDLSEIRKYFGYECVIPDGVVTSVVENSEPSNIDIIYLNNCEDPRWCMGLDVNQDGVFSHQDLEIFSESRDIGEVEPLGSVIETKPKEIIVKEKMMECENFDSSRDVRRCKRIVLKEKRIGGIFNWLTSLF